ncbi:MAG: hypothetical protein WD981_05680 [Gaiellaceae bacterium]
MTKRLLILLALAAAAFAVALAAPGAADAAKPCWVRLINDWFDGRIDKSYPVNCYRAAIKNLPEDVEAYSNAREEIQRALLAAINKSKREGDTLTGSDPVPPQVGPIGRTSTLPGGTTDTTPDEGDGVAAPGTGDSGDDGPLGVLKPANADSVPVPLLVLAGLALVLLAAASAGFVARRLQARRAGGTGLPRGPDGP